MRKKKAQKVHKNGTESDLERLFLAEWLSRYPSLRPLTQLKFHPKREWRFDFSWPMKKIAVEVQGMGPGHCSLRGMTNDYDKALAAQLLGWRIAYVTSTHLSPRRVESVCIDIAKLLGVVTPPSAEYVPIHKRGL
jgi:hypothetical protein